MHADVKAHFAALEEAIQSTAIPDDRKEVITGWIKRLTLLYPKFQQTNESRHGDEMTAVVQSLLKELQVCPEARKLDADFRAKLRSLHEDLGLPQLTLKASPPPPKPKRTAKK